MTQQELDRAVTLISNSVIDIITFNMSILNNTGATAKDQMDIMTSVVTETIVHLFSCASTSTPDKLAHLQDEVRKDMQKYVDIVINN